MVTSHMSIAICMSSLEGSHGEPRATLTIPHPAAASFLGPTPWPSRCRECWSLGEQAWAGGQWEGGLYKGWAPSQPVNKHLKPSSEPSSPTPPPLTSLTGGRGKDTGPRTLNPSGWTFRKSRVMHPFYRLQEKHNPLLCFRQCQTISKDPSLHSPTERRVPISQPKRWGA